MIKNLELSIDEKIWMYRGKGAWFFITIPKQDAEKIKFFSSPIRRGWGALRVSAKIGNTNWKTSIFPDSRSASYLLPIKAEVRKKEKLSEGDSVSVELEVSF